MCGRAATWTCGFESRQGRLDNLNGDWSRSDRTEATAHRGCESTVVARAGGSLWVPWTGLGL